ncbi:lipoate--protein ligase family protein [Bifidobacterium sp. UTBIF-78]|uniref:lipoate--protein ligase family protein n=1 Tax=Bifidobacterium sp. UTBIF-78 TaxID=1465263 RepID=UPI002159704E|nr:lipoate--protein ligase family protein [Bifidobacterium sp. UTBIF-78]TPF94273.1 hypothetical protein BG22_05700 [Bifidobacterium sp. UTBIF-78]
MSGIIGRGEYKTPGGKLVAVTVVLAGHAMTDVAAVDGAIAGYTMADGFAADGAVADDATANGTAVNGSVADGTVADDATANSGDIVRGAGTQVGTPVGAVVESCRVDGDFFVEAASDAESEALLHDIELALAQGRPVRVALDAHPDVRLVGTDADAIETAYARALAGLHAGGTEQSDDSRKYRGESIRRSCKESTRRRQPVQKRASVNPSQGDSFALFERNSPDAVADSSQGDSPDVAPGQAGGLGHTGELGHTKECHAEELSHAEEYRARWESLRRNLVVVHDIPRMPAEQMTIDETWAREVATGERRPTLRLWEWAGPAVVIGRFQSAPDEVNLDVAERYGFDVVRRCTGGGAMFIEPGNTITYSLYAPLDFVRGVSIEESYRLCDWWLVESLRGLGLDVRFAGLNDIASQYGKIGGAAQRRFPVDTGRAGAAAVTADADAKGAAEDAGAGFGRGRGRGAGAVLHHVTMAYDIDAAKMGAVLNTSREKMSDKAVKSAVKRVDPLRSQTGLSREAIIDHLLAWFA